MRWVRCDVFIGRIPKVTSSRKFLIGVDEAGYGPNLGPLVIAASLWTVPADCSETQLTQLLTPTFTTCSYAPGCEHIPLGDSKQLYSPSHGLSTLEAGLLALCWPLVQPLKRPSKSLPNLTHYPLAELLTAVASPETLDELTGVAWYAGTAQQSVPVGLSSLEEVERLASIARRSLQRVDVELLAVRSQIVCEPMFNRQLDSWGSKGEVLSRATLELVTQLLPRCTAATEVFCDRQGGRKNYLPQLLQALPDEWFTQTAQSDHRSSYRNQGSRPLEIHFSVGGDSFPPCGLASMLAKYLRERLMHALNAYWQQHISDLPPTAGYPLDAKRFRLAIEPTAQRLGWSPALWWRNK